MLGYLSIEGYNIENPDTCHWVKRNQIARGVEQSFNHDMGAFDSDMPRRRIRILDFFETRHDRRV